MNGVASLFNNGYSCFSVFITNLALLSFVHLHDKNSVCSFDWTLFHDLSWGGVRRKNSIPIFFLKISFVSIILKKILLPVEQKPFLYYLQQIR